MPDIFRYLTHPNVQIDPHKPVPEWSLSEIGRTRALRFAGSDVLRRTKLIASSDEVKAVETADLIAKALGLTVERRPLSHENDRSGTGFLPPDEFEQVADAFFASPRESIRGWERAIDAQARIVAEAEAVLSGHLGDDILMVGHGAVGTLLMCHFAGEDIARRFDQPAGGGNLFAMDIAKRELSPHWQPMEAF